MPLSRRELLKSAGLLLALPAHKLFPVAGEEPEGPGFDESSTVTTLEVEVVETAQRGVRVASYLSGVTPISDRIMVPVIEPWPFRTLTPLTLVMREYQVATQDGMIRLDERAKPLQASPPQIKYLHNFLTHLTKDEIEEVIRNRMGEFEFEDDWGDDDWDKLGDMFMRAIYEEENQILVA